MKGIFTSTRTRVNENGFVQTEVGSFELEVLGIHAPQFQVNHVILYINISLVCTTDAGQGTQINRIY